jgi:acyl-CoA dehydrogenase
MNEDLRTLLERMRGFVRDEVVPAEPGLDQGVPGVAGALREQAARRGLWALPLPAEHGGGGLDLARYFELAEAEGASDYGPDLVNSSCLLNVRLLLEHADPAVRDRVVPELVQGRVRACYAMTEPGVSGSDPARLRTAARRTPSGWTICGHKWFISGAAQADHVLVLARTDPEAEPRGAFSLFLVPASAPGLRVVRELDVLGAGGQYELELNEVAVGEDALVGRAGAGLAMAGRRLALGRTLRALRWVGQAQRALDLLAERAAGRGSGPGVLADRQLIQRLMFEAELQVRSARLLARQAAALVAADRRAPVEVGLAKVAAARALHIAVDSAVQVYGAEGLTSASGLPRLARWARAARILDGAEELLVADTGRRLLAPERRPESVTDPR